MHELVHGHQLHGGDTQVLEIVNRGVMAQAGIGAAEVLGNTGQGGGHALDVQLVDDRLMVLDLRATIIAPVEVRVDHH